MRSHSDRAAQGIKRLIFCLIAALTFMACGREVEDLRSGAATDVNAFAVAESSDASKSTRMGFDVLNPEKSLCDKLKDADGNPTQSSKICACLAATVSAVVLKKLEALVGAWKYLNGRDLLKKVIVDLLKAGVGWNEVKAILQCSGLAIGSLWEIAKELYNIGAISLDIWNQIDEIERQCKNPDQYTSCMATCTDRTMHQYWDNAFRLSRVCPNTMAVENIRAAIRGSLASGCWKDFCTVDYKREFTGAGQCRLYDAGKSLNGMSIDQYIVACCNELAPPARCYIRR